MRHTIEEVRLSGAIPANCDGSDVRRARGPPLTSGHWGEGETLAKGSSERARQGLTNAVHTRVELCFAVLVTPEAFDDHFRDVHCGPLRTQLRGRDRAEDSSLRHKDLPNGTSAPSNLSANAFSRAFPLHKRRTTIASVVAVASKRGDKGGTRLPERSLRTPIHRGELQGQAYCSGNCKELPCRIFWIRCCFALRTWKKRSKSSTQSTRRPARRQTTSQTKYALPFAAQQLATSALVQSLPKRHTLSKREGVRLPGLPPPGSPSRTTKSLPLSLFLFHSFSLSLSGLLLSTSFLNLSERHR